MLHKSILLALLTILLKKTDAQIKDSVSQKNNYSCLIGLPYGINFLAEWRYSLNENTWIINRAGFNTNYLFSSGTFLRSNDITYRPIIISELRHMILQKQAKQYLLKKKVIPYFSLQILNYLNALKINNTYPSSTSLATAAFLGIGIQKKINERFFIEYTSSLRLLNFNQNNRIINKSIFNLSVGYKL